MRTNRSYLNSAAFNYLPPAAAGVVISLLILLCAVLFLKETRPPLRATSPLGKSLLPSNYRTSPLSRHSSISRHSPLAQQGQQSVLEAAMSSHASRASFILDSGDHSGPSSPIMQGGTTTRTTSTRLLLHALLLSLSLSLLNGAASSSADEPRLVSAVALALHHTLSPKATRPSLFNDSRISPSASVVKTGGGIPPVPEAPAGLTAERRKRVFWTAQLASLLFTMTNVGLTDVLPVWLASPPSHGTGGGLGLQSSAIGKLQSFTGFGNIALALFLT